MTLLSTKMNHPMRKTAPIPLGRPQCCSRQAFKRAGVLLAFHLLNVLVAIGGVISVALLLVSMALMPIWFIAVVVIVLVASILDVIQHIKSTCLQYCAYAVAVVLYLASLTINWYMIGPYVVIVAGGLGVGMFFLSAGAMKILMKTDVIFVNFVTTDDSNVRDPDECQDQFNLSDTTDGSYVLPHSRMTRHVWLAVIYFASFKLIIGALSIAVVAISVVLPVVLLSGGDIPVFGGQVKFNGSAVLIFAVWLVGVVGVSVVAVLSVKTTLWVCGIGLQQTEIETQSAIPATPTLESATINFSEMHPSTPAAAV